MTMPAAVTLADYAERWLRRCRVRGRPLSLATVAGYESVLRLHIVPTLGHVPVADLSRRQVRAWYDALTDRRGRSVAAESYALLRALCNSAVDDDLLAATPCTLRGAGNTWSPERPVLTVDQVMALAGEVARGYRAVVLLGAFCCLRMGELAALQRAAIDLDRAMVTVRASAGYVNGHGWVVGEPKRAAATARS